MSADVRELVAGVEPKLADAVEAAAIGGLVAPSSELVEAAGLGVVGAVGSTLLVVVSPEIIGGVFPRLATTAVSRFEDKVGFRLIG